MKCWNLGRGFCWIKKRTFKDLLHFFCSIPKKRLSFLHWELLSSILLQQLHHSPDNIIYLIKILFRRLHWRFTILIIARYCLSGGDTSNKLTECQVRKLKNFLFIFFFPSPLKRSKFPLRKFVKKISFAGWNSDISTIFDSTTRIINFLIIWSRHALFTVSRC